MSVNQRRFDHDLARELYRGGALIEALARKFGVSEQAIRFAVIPGELEKQRQRVLRKRERDRAAGLPKKV